MNFFSDIGSLIVPVSIAPELKDSKKIVCRLLTTLTGDRIFTLDCSPAANSKSTVVRIFQVNFFSALSRQTLHNIYITKYFTYKKYFRGIFESWRADKA